MVAQEEKQLSLWSQRVSVMTAARAEHGKVAGLQRCRAFRVRRRARLHCRSSSFAALLSCAGVQSMSQMCGSDWTQRGSWATSGGARGSREDVSGRVIARTHRLRGESSERSRCVVQGNQSVVYMYRKRGEQEEEVVVEGEREGESDLCLGTRRWPHRHARLTDKQAAERRSFSATTLSSRATTRTRYPKYSII